MSEYNCPHCGKSHEGDPTDWGWVLPDDVWAIPEEQRNELAQFSEDLCLFDGRYFIRCVLPLPFKDRDGYFGWGVWAEVEQAGFADYLKVYEIDGSDEPRIFGLLANEMPGYDNPSSCVVELQFGPSDQRPVVLFPEGTSTKLASEQRLGIGAQRYHEILDTIGAD